MPRVVDIATSLPPIMKPCRHCERERPHTRNGNARHNEALREAYDGCIGCRSHLGGGGYGAAGRLAFLSQPLAARQHKSDEALSRIDERAAQKAEGNRWCWIGRHYLSRQLFGLEGAQYSSACRSCKQMNRAKKPSLTGQALIDDNEYRRRRHELRQAETPIYEAIGAPVPAIIEQVDIGVWLAQRKYAPGGMHAPTGNDALPAPVVSEGAAGALPNKQRKELHPRMAKLLELSERDAKVKRASKPTDRGKPANLDKSGFVYVISDGSAVKIGLGAVFDRIRTMQVGNANELVPICTLWSDDNDKLEKGLHKKFKHLWIRGEWFRPTDELLSHFRSASASAYQESRSKELPYADDPRLNGALPPIDVMQWVIQQPAAQKLMRQYENTKTQSEMAL